MTAFDRTQKLFKRVIKRERKTTGKPKKYLRHRALNMVNYHFYGYKKILLRIKWEIQRYKFSYI